MELTLTEALCVVKPKHFDTRMTFIDGANWQKNDCVQFKNK